jgi:hypothetical protein
MRPDAYLTGLTSVRDPGTLPAVVERGTDSNKSSVSTIGGNSMKWPRLYSQSATQIHGVEMDAVTTEIRSPSPPGAHDPSANRILKALGWPSDGDRNKRYLSRGNIAGRGSVAGQGRSSTNSRTTNAGPSEGHNPEGITVTYEVRRTEELAEV